MPIDQIQVYPIPTQKEQQQSLTDFENGVIVKIYKSQVDPILVWGCLHHPKNKLGIASGPTTRTIKRILTFYQKEWHYMYVFIMEDTFDGRQPLIEEDLDDL